MQNQQPVIVRAGAAQSWLALLLLSAPVAACVGQVSSSAECEARIIVGLERAPDEELVAALAQTARAQLALIGEVTSTLHVFTVRSAGTDDQCSAAIERLRADPRVHSVDIDARREAHPR